jgi:CHAD domain-containing protein
MTSLAGQFLEDPDKSTHEIRKSTKRVRALYKLYKNTLSETAYMQGQESYRNISALLAEIRLSAVHCATLLTLSSTLRGPQPQWLTRLIHQCRKHHNSILSRIDEEADIPGTLTKHINTAIDITLSEVPAVRDFHQLAAGIRKTYANGRNQLATALEQPTAEKLHNLRKTVKYLWNQIIFLKPLWPPMLGITIKNLDVLAERLGYDHDLAELAHHQQRNRTLSKKNQVSLNDLVGAKRLQVQKKIFPLATRLFAESPGTFSNRLEAYFRIYTT